MTKDLSVIIIAYNNEDQIERCIRSIEDIAAEILVLDANSTDFTARMSGYLGANVIREGQDHSSDLFTKGIKVAKHEWILLLHGHEEIRGDLKMSIAVATSHSVSPRAFRIKRENYYCGKKMHFGQWKPSTDTRLVHKSLLNSRLSFQWKKNEKEFEVLDGLLQVHTYSSIEHHRHDIDHKTRLRARQFIYYPGYIKLKMVFEPTWSFLQSFIGKLGFLDGVTGYRLSKMLFYERLTNLRCLKEQHEHIVSNI